MKYSFAIILCLVSSVVILTLNNRSSSDLAKLRDETYRAIIVEQQIAMDKQSATIQILTQSMALQDSVILLLERDNSLQAEIISIQKKTIATQDKSIGLSSNYWTRQR